MRKVLLPVSCLLMATFSAPPVPAAELPRKSPEFEISMNSGKSILLSQYRGKPLVLAFILTTCSHCQYTTGLLVKDQAEYGPKGLQVLECAVNDGARMMVPAFVQQFRTNFPVGYTTDQDGVFRYLEQPLSVVPQMPILVFIDRTGTIRAQYQGRDAFMEEGKQEQNLRNEIEKLLLPPPGARRKSAVSH